MASRGLKYQIKQLRGILLSMQDYLCSEKKDVYQLQKVGFVCRWVGRMMAPTLSYSFYLIVTGALSSVHLVILFYFRLSVGCLAVQGSPVATEYVVSVESSSLILQGIYRDLFVHQLVDIFNSLLSLSLLLTLAINYL